MPLAWLAAHWEVPVALLLALARELDFDKAFTGEGILQARLYTGPSPLAEKAIGLAIVALILVAAWRLARRGLPAVLRAMGRRAVWAWLAVLSIAAIGGAKVLLDGAGRKLLPLGIEISEELNAFLGTAEEWVELAGGIGLLLAVPLWAHGARR